jgi:hypothetical protein
MPDGEYWGSPQAARNPVSGAGIASERARDAGTENAMTPLGDG